MNLFNEAYLFLLNHNDAAQLMAVFWFLLLLDIPRYVLTDIILIPVYLWQQYCSRHQRQLARQQLFRERPLISVIAPGKNEGSHIPKLAESLKQQTYQNLETIVVDDGSDDETALICRLLQKQRKITLFLSNPIRGGKASGANLALRYCKGKYIVHLDADSHLRNDSIERILIPFYLDENIGAVGGDVRIRNTETSLATALQTIEYMRSISVGRVVNSTLGILRLISGAHGAFRKDILDRLGGWDVGPGLDGDITVKIRKLGYRIYHEPNAVCYTNAPFKFTNLGRQRFRWDRSLVRFRMRKHRDLMEPQSGFTFSNFFSAFDNIFFNFLLNIKWWLYVLSVIFYNPDFLLMMFILNWAAYSFLNVFEYGVAMMLYLYGGTVRSIEWKMLLYLPLMPIYTGFYLRFVRTFSHFMEVFFKASFYDPWNPWKVSRKAKENDL